MESNPEFKYLRVGRQQISKWFESKDLFEAIRQFLINTQNDVREILIFAAVTDTSVSEVTMRKINVDLPIAVMDVARQLDIGVRTFGSVLESKAPKSSSYLMSKLDLSNEVEARREKGENVLHVRFHTHYGAGEPSPHMFLGQALAAIRTGKVFEMSSGNQIRQYQHVDDLLGAISLVLNENGKAIYEISHSENLTLREIAESVFSHFGCKELLRIGVLPSHPLEVTKPDYPVDACYAPIKWCR